MQILYQRLVCVSVYGSELSHVCLALLKNQVATHGCQREVAQAVADSPARNLLQLAFSRFIICIKTPAALFVGVLLSNSDKRVFVPKWGKNRGVMEVPARSKSV